MDEHTAQHMLMLLRGLFNTVTGVCAWTPTLYGEQKIVVVSVPFVIWFLELPGNVNVTAAQVRTFFGKDLHASRSPALSSLGNLNVVYKSDEFRDAVLATPFKLPNNRNRYAEDFFVAHMDEWMQLMSAHKNMINVVLDISVPVPEAIGQRMALGGKRVRKKRYTVHKSQLHTIPAMGVEWWTELFSPTVKECFGIGDGEFVHVLCCKKLYGSEPRAFETGFKLD